MGYPMARHLLAAGHTVALWSHTISKAAKLAGEFPATATVVDSPKEVAAASDVIFFIVGDTAMSESIVFGDTGLLAGAKPGTVIVDASTVAPSYSLSTSKKCAEKGVQIGRAHV